jgi:hypothetical protein
MTPEPSEARRPASLEQIIDDQIVRGFKHVEWLSQLAVVLEIANNKRGGGTPFQKGAVNRVRMAVRYIELLEREARDAARHIAGLEDDIKLLKGNPEEEGR